MSVLQRRCSSKIQHLLTFGSLALCSDHPGPVPIFESRKAQTLAAYREHISVSGIVGLAYGAIGTWGMGFSGDQGFLAAFLTWVAGMLPDIDSKSGKPIRELFSLLAILVPLGLMQHLVQLGGNRERVFLLAVVTYLMIRYGGASLLSRLAVHRGMFHSIPALIIAAELTFLGYSSDSSSVRAFMAGGVAIGFFSHLLLDEMYSVQWDGVKVRLAKSAGSALKLTGPRFFPNAFTWGLMFFLSYTSLVSVGVIAEPAHAPTAETAPSEESPESATPPANRTATLPADSPSVFDSGAPSSPARQFGPGSSEPFAPGRD